MSTKKLRVHLLDRPELFGQSVYVHYIPVLGKLVVLYAKYVDRN